MFYYLFIIYYYLYFRLDPLQRMAFLVSLDGLEVKLNASPKIFIIFIIIGILEIIYSSSLVLFYLFILFLSIWDLGI
jgi:hypothetical protein